MSFENIYGYNHIKKELYVVIDILNNKEKYQKTGAKLPAGVLLYGEPGLGKTLFANEFINSLTNRNKYIIRKNRPDGEFVNYLTEKITEAISNAPSIVLLDDMDKFANDDEKHRNSEEFVTIQTLVDDAKDKDVFFIATANDITNIPESLLRDGRFNYIYEFNAPRIDDAKEIVKHYLEGKNLASDIDYEEIAKLLGGRSCATLEKIMNEATIMTTYNNKSIIERSDILSAILRVVYGGPVDEDNDNEYAKKVAIYHEAGHTLVSEILDKGSVTLVSVGNYFSDKGGLTASQMPKEYWSRLDLMENRIKVLLAGKAAIEVFLNTTDLGAGSDLNRVKRMIGRIVDEYAEMNFKYWATDRYEKSESLKSDFEQEANARFEKAYFETKKILREHEEEYYKIVELLSNNDVVTQRELKPIFA